MKLCLWNWKQDIGVSGKTNTAPAINFYNTHVRKHTFIVCSLFLKWGHFYASIELILIEHTCARNCATCLTWVILLNPLQDLWSWYPCLLACLFVFCLPAFLEEAVLDKAMMIWSKTRCPPLESPSYINLEPSSPFIILSFTASSSVVFLIYLISIVFTLSDWELVPRG